MEKYKDQNPGYWDDFNNFQKVKHDVIKHYLDGWFPILGQKNNRILYIDTHAGRGKHQTGELGSPLIALETFKRHKSKDRILENCVVDFTFIERDESNYKSLKQEIERFGSLPNGVNIRIENGECFNVLKRILGEISCCGKDSPPAFIFIDPYGFKVECSIFKELMNLKKVELFINIMWQELSWATNNRTHIETLNTMFGTEKWKDFINAPLLEDRVTQTINYIKSFTQSRWSTYISMAENNFQTRYFLLHLTNHQKGRTLMKDCIWKICPNGIFDVKRNNKNEFQYLFEGMDEPDLRPLKEWICSELKKKPQKWGDLSIPLLDEIWRDAQMNEVIKKLQKEKKVEAVETNIKFTCKANPTLRLVGSHENQN